jgi:hypothetical protein
MAVKLLNKVRWDVGTAAGEGHAGLFNAGAGCFVLAAAGNGHGTSYAQHWRRILSENRSRNFGIVRI